MQLPDPIRYCSCLVDILIKVLANISGRIAIKPGTIRKACDSSSRSACIDISTVPSDISTISCAISTSVAGYIALEVVIGVNTPRDISTVPGVTSVIARDTSEVVIGANSPRDSSHLNDLYLIFTA